MAVTVAFGAREEGLSAANRKHTKEAKDHEQAIKDTARAAKDSERTQKEGHREIRRELGGLITQYVGIQSAIQGINQLYTAWIQNERERVGLAKTGIDAARNLALLQPRGTVDERINRAAAMASARGVFRTPQEQAQAFNVIQAAQSQAETQVGAEMAFDEGLRRASAIFQASQVGLDVPTAQMLVRLGAAQGFEDPTQFLRFGLRAGQVSEASAEEVATAASRLQLFQDKAFGFAVAAQQTTAVSSPEMARTATAQIARAIQIDLDRERLGVTAEASGLEVLREMRSQGIDTLKELREVGIVNAETGPAILSAIEKVETIAQFTQELRKVQQPGFLASEQARLEAESPMFATRRRLAELESEAQFRRMFDVEAMQDEIRRRELGMRFQAETGRETTFGMDIADETGNVTPFMEGVLRGMSLGGGRGALAPQDVQERNERQTRAMEEARDLIRQQNNQALPNRPAN